MVMERERERELERARSTKPGPSRVGRPGTGLLDGEKLGMTRRLDKSKNRVSGDARNMRPGVES